METFPIIEFSDHWIIPLLIALYDIPFAQNVFFKFGLTELHNADIYCKRVWLSHYLSGKLISKMTNKLGTVHESVHIAQRSNRKLYFHCFVVVALPPICRPSVKTSLISHRSPLALSHRFFDVWLWWLIQYPLYGILFGFERLYYSTKVVTKFWYQHNVLWYQVIISINSFPSNH